MEELLGIVIRKSLVPELFRGQVISCKKFLNLIWKDNGLSTAKLDSNILNP